jgi:hypothetical protein
LLAVRKPAKALAAFFYFLFAVALAFHCYRNSNFDIDLLAFAGNVALTDTPDPVRAHAIVYQYPLTPHLRGADADNPQARILRRRASDPYYSTLYLPYFSIKPLYILTMEAVHKAGATVIDASRVVSSLCFLGIAIALWLYLPSPLALAILILPECIMLGQANEADGMSVMLLLFALWAVFVKDKQLGVLPLIASVWVRPDNLLLCLAVLIFLWITGEFRWRETLVLVALTVATNMTISHYGYGLRALYFHTFLGGEPNQIASFGFMDFIHALVGGTKQALHSSAPVYGLLWLVCLVKLRDRKLRTILALVGFSLLVRFLIFPNYEPRYYGLFFILTAVGACRLILEAEWKRPSQLLGDAVLSHP